MANRVLANPGLAHVATTNLVTNNLASANLALAKLALAHLAIATLAIANKALDNLALAFLCFNIVFQYVGLGELAMGGGGDQGKRELGEPRWATHWTLFINASSENPSKHSLARDIHKNMS